MTDYEKYPKFVSYERLSVPILDGGTFEFNQEIDKTKHDSYEALNAKWVESYSKFKDVLATANHSSNPDQETQKLINETVTDFNQWGLEFARYGYFLGWKATTDYLDLAKGFAALDEKVYTDPTGERDLLEQHLENLDTLKKGHFPDGDPESKEKEEDDRGRKRVVRRTVSG